MTVVTRFAPSPTGFLHIGGARTALFNWAFARANQGQFLLRIEDTDRERSTPEATQAIFDGLDWLGLQADGDPLFQFARADRHREIAHAMIENGTAYKCYSTAEEIAQWRDNNPHQIFHSPWRDQTDAPDAPYSIRLKTPKKGVTIVHDAVQGEVIWQNENLDDLILLRSDGTPTYMLAVVVDDHDMGVTHVIRGDDHLTNAARQTLIYQANDWSLPIFAHIPLIHGADGKKLSKRHGDLGAEAYRDMGYPSSAMRNYLARLGWAHGDMEFFNDYELLDVFDLAGINKAAARLDRDKLDAVSAWHIRHMGNQDLIDSLKSFVAAQNSIQLDTEILDRIAPHLDILREKAKKLGDLVDYSQFLVMDRPINIDEKSQKIIAKSDIDLVQELTSQLQNVSWHIEDIEQMVKSFANHHEVGLGKILQPIRAALAGGTPSPSVYEMLVALGRDESLARIQDAFNWG